MDLRDAHYQFINPKRLDDRLTQSVLNAVLGLERASLAATFPHADQLKPERIEYYLGQNEAMRRDAARSVKAATLWYHPAVARQRGVLAVDGNGDPLAYLGVADVVENAEGWNKGLRGVWEKQTKLRAPWEAIKERIFWLSSIVLHESVRGAIMADPSRGNPVHVKFALAADGHNKQQPVHTYLPAHEVAAGMFLESLGLVLDPGAPKVLFNAFGAENDPNSYMMFNSWEADTIEDCLRRCGEKPGVTPAIRRAWREL